MAALAPFTEIPGRCNWMKHLFPDCDNLNDRASVWVPDDS